MIVMALVIVSVTCYMAFAKDIPCGSTYKSKRKGEIIRCVVPTPKPTPIPTSAPTPKPTATPVPTSVPTPQPSPSPGVVCSKTVSSGQSIQDAINSSINGQTVCVKSGLYNEHVNINKSISLVSHPENTVKPVIEPNGSRSSVKRVEINAPNVIIRGLEIRKGYDGVKVYKSGAKILDNYIHDNAGQGILLVSVSDYTIEGNRISANGKDCYNSGWGGVSPKHCHGIYESNYTSTCANMTGGVVKNNLIEDNPGIGVSMNGQQCQSRWIENQSITGNIFDSNCTNVFAYHRVRNWAVKDNTFISGTCPAGDVSASDKVHINIWYSPDPAMSGNTFSGSYPIFKRVQ